MKKIHYKFVILISSILLLMASCEKKPPESAQQKASECLPASTPEEQAKTGYEHITPPEIEGVVWQTNLDEKPFASPDALRCGTLRSFISDFPLNFRLFGPESNSGGFVSYKRDYAFLSLVARHPVTFNYVPELATHWALLDDGKTAYFHLDSDARWSDGKPITAEDYTYTIEFFTSDHLKAPFYKQYYSETYEAIEKVSDSVIKVTLKKPSWRLLEEANLSPVPQHDTQLDEKWLETYQWKMPVVPGAYVLETFERGKSVEFKRIKDWWGDKKLYMRNKFNFDRLNLQVVREESVAYLMFQKGELDMFLPDPPKWERESDFEAVKKGYVLKRKIKKQVFNGASGIFFNAQDTVWKDALLRRAFSHVLDFDTINKQFLYSLYDRRHTFFKSVTPYETKDLQAYPYDIAQAEKLLDEAGWKRTKGSAFREKNGKKLELELIYGTERYDQQLPLIKEAALKAGIDLVLKKHDDAALYKTWGDKSYSATILSFGGVYYPSPRQFFHSESVEKNSNNMNMYSSPEVDKLIKTFESDLDEAKRVSAIRRIEQIVHDQALLLPFWINNNDLILHWRHIKGPSEFITKSGLLRDYLWYDDAEADRVFEAQKSKKDMEIPPVAADPYKITQN